MPNTSSLLNDLAAVSAATTVAALQILLKRIAGRLYNIKAKKPDEAAQLIQKRKEINALIRAAGP